MTATRTSWTALHGAFAAARPAVFNLLVRLGAAYVAAGSVGMMASRLVSERLGRREHREAA
jgi:hypothetical protein